MDLCPRTGLEAVGADGCAKGQDGDGDGVETGGDLCPNTPAGKVVDAHGCSEEQRERGVGAGIFGGTTGGEEVSEETGSAAATTEEAKAILADPPETGSLRNGYVALVVDRESDRPMVFFTFASNLTVLDDGFEVNGALLLTTPIGFVPIANASVIFENGDDPNGGLERVRGEASVPFPSLGVLKGFSVDDLVSASIGFDLGKNLADLDAPLQPDRKYLFFDYAQGFEAKNGPVTISLPGSADATLILDPHDPFFFARGSLLGLSSLGPIEDVGLGISAQGLIPYAPETTYGLGGSVGAFAGHLYLSGSIPIPRLPMTLHGRSVLDVDPNRDGRPLSEVEGGGLQRGFNGELALTASFLQVLSFEAHIGQASVILRETRDEQSAHLSGVIEPDHSFLPDELPLRADYDLSVAGFVSSEIEDSYLAMEGDYRLVGSSLADKVGVELSDMAVAEARLDVDRLGFRLAGRLDSDVRLTGGVEIAGGARVTAFFADDPEEFFVELTGDVTIAGHELLDAELRMDDAGLFVSGELDTGVSRVAVSGFITRDGAELSGQANVSIDVQAGKEVVETVVDGAICGYTWVEDGAICGFEKVTDGAICGFEKITDGAVCGYEVVTNGALCGYHTVTDASKCGTELVTSAWHCGTSQICSVLKFIGIRVCDDKPNSCYVPRTCADLDAPKSCQDPSLPKTCNDLGRPKTCDDLAQPKTCEDLSKPRSCEHATVIPDFDYGSFEGDVDLRLSKRGLTGTVSGDYCAHGGACTRLGGGHVKLSDPFEACIDVPPSLGRFCAPF